MRNHRCYVHPTRRLWDIATDLWGWDWDDKIGVRYWVRCIDCALEVGPFVLIHSALIDSNTQAGRECEGK